MLTSRRAFVRNSAFALGFLGLTRCSRARVIEPYGPLIADNSRLLDLPEGFSYRVISRRGQAMSDGLRVPGKFDDMTAFPGKDGRVVLVRNHELAVNEGDLGPFPDQSFPVDWDRSLSYDPGEKGAPPQIGGTTTLVYNPAKGEVEEEFLSLTGTDRNCSGGIMPWGSWITCEESDDMTSERGRHHGYCFEVKADPDLGLQRAVPLKALGRFRHEAVALDPADGSLYLTEDRHDGLLYRFVPERERDFTKGTLYALALTETPSADLRNQDPEKKRVMKEGDVTPIRWIEMENTESALDDLRRRGFEAGAAQFARSEGIYYSDGALYLCCTNGGPNLQGQLFRVLPRHFGNDKPALELFLEPSEMDLLTNGDNLCAAPNGDLIVCEDLVSEHDEKSPHMRGVTPEGEIYTLARNAANGDEFCGSCFSPDGSILFVNMQGIGYTFAITGPWRS